MNGKLLALVVFGVGCAAEANDGATEETSNLVEGQGEIKGPTVLASGQCEAKNPINGAAMVAKAKIIQGGGINLFFGAPSINGAEKSNAFVEAKGTLPRVETINLSTVDQLSYNQPYEVTLRHNAIPVGATDIKYKLQANFDLPGDDPSCPVTLAPGGSDSCTATKSYAEKPLSATLALIDGDRKVRATFNGALTRSQNDITGTIEYTRQYSTPPLFGASPDNVPNGRWEKRNLNTGIDPSLKSRGLANVSGKVRMVFDIPRRGDVTCTIQLKQGDL